MYSQASTSSESSLAASIPRKARPAQERTRGDIGRGSRATQQPDSVILDSPDRVYSCEGRAGNPSKGNRKYESMLRAPRNSALDITDLDESRAVASDPLLFDIFEFCYGERMLEGKRGLID